MRKSIKFVLYKIDMKTVKDRRATSFCLSEWIVWRCEEYARKVKQQIRKEKALKRQRRKKDA